ncbi:hypothetical protein V6N11_067963 [Hibiscus sabdariffa]|uniref:RNase H type-1 domain-containing protein n=1 Tax=Hibiscus sabdariffa TaxID=183260 RepID=A0ABR2SSA6_9ROSI
MPLSSSNPDDAIIWRYDCSGCYSMKSGYRLLAHVANSRIGVSSTFNVDKVKRLYSALWSLAIPSKIKVMFWRFIKNYLPTNVNLYNKRIHLATNWILCAGEAETVDHILFCLSPPLDKKRMVLLVVSIWGIWSYRNNKIHNQVSQSAMDLVRFISSYVGELTSIADNAASLCSASRLHWLPPRDDAIKVNFDACFSSRYRTSFFGVVARNYRGSIMAIGTIPHRFVPSPEMAEAYACIDAILLARDAGFRSVIIEGDALTVINKANCRKDDRSVLRSLVMQIHGMQAFFISFTFSHAVRTCNTVAHLLAREGRDFSGPRFWIEKAPSSVEEATLKDKWWVSPQN